MTADELKKYLIKKGAGLVGIADLEPFKRERFAFDPELLIPYSRAISMAVFLEDEILDEIGERPTPRYADHYRDVNQRLDLLAQSAVEWLVQHGAKAEAVPASKILSTERLMGALSHKAIARMAGLGWQGKSLLLVTPEKGPRVRLVTVLTDMPLDIDDPLKNRCGECTKCTDACPVGAIRNIGTGDRYETREEAIDLVLCDARTLENVALEGVGARVCGICVQVCPWGKKRTGKAHND